jgi:hypothetical protein
MDARIGGADLHRAARVGGHRPDVHLVAVPARRLRAVVADRERQEVEHEVRPADLVVRADEAAALEVVRGAGPAAEEEPAEEDARPVAPLHRRRDRDGLRGAVLDVDLEVVLEVLADPRQVVDDVDPERAQLVRVADARELQQLRRVDRAAAEDHLVRADRLALHLDADRARPVEDDARDERPRAHLEVRAAQHGVEVRTRGAQPTAAVDVAVEAREALLLVAVDVGGELVPGLLHGREERLAERVRRRPALEDERPAAAAPLVGAGEAGLHPLEVREAVRVVPLLESRLARPALVVHRVAALEDHPVDRARAAEHLAARVVDAPPVHQRLGLGLVAPVVEAVAERDRQRGGHVDREVELPVAPPGLEHEHPHRRISAEPISKSAARRASADDHKVIHAQIP